MVSTFRFGGNRRFFGPDTADFVVQGWYTGHPISCRMRHPCRRRYLRCMRTIDAYAVGVIYGTEELKERVYKGPRQIVDKSKW